MNKTRKNLILSAGILLIIEAVILVISSVVIFVLLKREGGYLFNLIVSLEPDFTELGISFTAITILVSGLVEALFSTIAGICLILSIRKNGTCFQQSKGLYWTGVVFTIICGVISIPAILLYCSIGIGNRTESTIVSMPNVQSESENYEKVSSKEDGIIFDGDPNFKKKLEELRKLKDDGVITEEEFKALLMKLL